MRVVRDFSKALPIEAFELHFLLPADRFEQYASMLIDLNGDDSFKLGPFHISVHNIGEEMAGGFQSSVTELKDANLLTRVIDDSDDSYTYCCDTIRFADDWQDMVKQIEEFLFEAYLQSVKSLTELIDSYGKRGFRRRDYRVQTLFKIDDFLKRNRIYPPSDNSKISCSDELEFLFSDPFRNAFVKTDDFGIFDDSDAVLLNDQPCAKRISEHRILKPKSIDSVLQIKKKINRNRNKLRFVGDVLDAVEDNEEVRNLIFRALYGDKEGVRFDERGFPIADSVKSGEADFPDLTIGFQRSDNTRLRVRQSLKIEIDGSEYIVSLGTKSRVFYYALCLICRKKGIPFNRDILLGQRVGQRRELWRPETLWLRDLYRLLFGESTGRHAGEFMSDSVVDSGFRTLVTNMGYGIRDAKSRSNYQIQQRLSGLPQPIIDRCKISRGLPTYHGVDWIDLPEQCIQLDHRFDQLLDSFPAEFAEYVPDDFSF